MIFLLICTFPEKAWANSSRDFLILFLILGLTPPYATFFDRAFLRVLLGLFLFLIFNYFILPFVVFTVIHPFRRIRPMRQIYPLRV
jgi:large-conductance mechanosensitive channel